MCLPKKLLFIGCATKQVQNQERERLEIEVSKSKPAHSMEGGQSLFPADFIADETPNVWACCFVRSFG